MSNQPDPSIETGEYEEPSRRVQLEQALEDVDREQRSLMRIKWSYVVAALVVGCVFAAGFVIAVIRLAGGEASGAPAGRPMGGQLLGLLFFLLPTALTFKYAFKRIGIHRRRRRLETVKAKLRKMIRDLDSDSGTNQPEDE